MAKPEYPAELPEDLSASVGLAASEEVGHLWDIGVDGIGYMLSTLDQESPFEFRSYELQSITRQKQQVDDQNEPGEQTLFPWWARAQHSWHEGAGQEIFDSPLSSRFAFEVSKGMDPWTESELSLLKDTEELRNDTVDDHHLVSTEAALIYTFDGNIKKDPDPDAVGEGSEATVATHSGTEINSVTYDGESIYAAFQGGALGIQKIEVDAFSAWAVVNTHLAVDLIGFVKGRLLGAKANQLFEYDLAGTTPPEPFFTDIATTWIFTGITESGPAIYFSGFAGDRSEILASRLTAQDLPYASVATLGAIRSVWQAPEGETIHTIKGYIGQAVLIGTSKGVRIGNIVSEDGDLRVSALIAETDDPVLKFEPQGEFAWFGWSNYDGTSSGLGRVHLGDLVYSSDLMFAGLGNVKDVVQYMDRLYYVLDEGATSRIVKEHATELVASGTLLTGEIRYGTTERKSIRYFDILSSGTGQWSLHMGINNNALAPFTTDNDSGGYEEEVLSLEGTRFRAQITLTRDAGDATLGPTLLEWRLRAEPRTTGRFRYLVPVMVYDHVLNVHGREVGFAGMALSILTHLETSFRLDNDILFQPLQKIVPGASATTISVKMEDLRFKTYSPPKGGRGFGGIALMVLREVR